MTDPQIPDDVGSDYGYDLAHDVPRTTRDPARRPEPPQPPRPRGPASPLTGGDYGYDEAHDIP